MVKFAFEFEQAQVQLLMAMPTVVSAAYAALGASIQEQVKKGPIPDQPPAPQPRSNGEAQPEAQSG